MRKRARFHIAGVLAIVISSSAAFGAAERQQSPVSDVVAALVQQPDTAPLQKKQSTNVFDPLGMQGFSVALVLGETHGSSTPDNLPAGARKALADLREFLPYKSYRLLDTQWIRCCAGPNVGGRLRGLDDQQYAFHLGISGVSGSKFFANFSLTDAEGIDITPGKFNSNFSMETGETVVIGTSSLKGDRALVVLLTAVPRATTAVTKKGSGE